VSPNADDGCETNLHDVMHCGGCNTVCNPPHATPKCPTGTCQLQACEAGNFDCDANATTGCECPGVDLMDGMKGCCATGTCQTQHGDGYAHSFYDCVAFGTYTLGLAQDAAKAYNLTGANKTFCDSALDCSGTPTYYCVRRDLAAVAKECLCWGFAGAVKGLTSHNPTGDCTTLNLPWQ
jgi:hypothetical protein